MRRRKKQVELPEAVQKAESSVRFPTVFPNLRHT